MNIQPPERRASIEGRYEVHSIFPTIQGEGPFAGEPAIFVRLSGCNLQCPLCDTDYTSKRINLNSRSILAIIKDLQKEIDTSLVVITGGEPFRQQLEHLITVLIENGLFVQIETNGTLYQSLPFDSEQLILVCSPKTGNIHNSLKPHIELFKYVAKAEDLGEDGLPISALNHPAAPFLYRPEKDEVSIYLQPVDEQDVEKNLANQKAVVESCIKNGYRLCLQLHKIINAP